MIYSAGNRGSRFNCQIVYITHQQTLELYPTNQIQQSPLYEVESMSEISYYKRTLFPLPEKSVIRVKVDMLVNILTNFFSQKIKLNK